MKNFLPFILITVLGATACKGQNRSSTKPQAIDTPRSKPGLILPDSSTSAPPLLVPDTHRNYPMPVLRPDSKQNNMPVVKPKPGVQPK